MQDYIYNQELRDGRKIQIWTATWASKPVELELAGGDPYSVRCYYKNSAGGFRRTSPEVSIRELADLVRAVSDCGQFPAQCQEMKSALSGA